jgi:hypothetical protein
MFRLQDLRSFAAFAALYFLAGGNHGGKGCTVLGFQMTMMASSPPMLGIGAVFFRPQGLKVDPASTGTDDSLVEAGKFFTEAFW